MDSYIIAVALIRQVKYHVINFSCWFWLTQDNIKDKMRSIPFEVSTEIIGVGQNKQTNLPHLLPILDPSQPSKDITEVNNQATFINNQLLKQFC